jgi:hypothetical protein
MFYSTGTRYFPLYNNNKHKRKGTFKIKHNDNKILAEILNLKGAYKKI